MLLSGSVLGAGLADLVQVAGLLTARLTRAVAVAGPSPMHGCARAVPACIVHSRGGDAVKIRSCSELDLLRGAAPLTTLYSCSAPVIRAGPPVLVRMVVSIRTSGNG